MSTLLDVKEIAVDAQGYVLVDGKRVVNNASGWMLKHLPVAMYTCQRCRQITVPVRQKVVSEWEDAMDARKYYHTAAVPVPAYCPPCQEATRQMPEGGAI